MAAMNTPGGSLRATLHYIFDPLCGWCYAVAPLVQAVRDLPGLTLALHGGGMLTGVNRRAVTPQWRAYVLPHDRRIELLSGQPFGEAYFEGLLRDAGAMMDSEPPTTAMLAAEALAGRGLDMLRRQQRAHYVEGLRIAERPVLVALAVDLGLPAADFEAAYERLSGEATWTHIGASRQWLARIQGQGFPSFALSHGPGAPQALDIGSWLGRPDAWRADLMQRLSRPTPALPSGCPAPACDLDGCTP